MPKRKVIVHESNPQASEAPETPVPATEATTAPEPAPEPASAPAEAPAPDAKPTKKTKAKKAAGEITLADLTERYGRQMEDDGKSPGTISSYLMELKLACRELGEDTLIASLTEKRVAKFFGCDAVMKLRSGRDKSQLSIDKSRRVLRLALVWAEQEGLVAKAPVPEAARA